MKQIPVWFDTDMGVDDASAALVLFRQSALRVVGISAVAGNVELCHTYDNVRRLLRLIGEDCPVYQGAKAPLLKELTTAAHIHGADGLGGAILPPSDAPETTEPAWDALYRAALEYKGELRVIAVGPLTDLAIALGKYPQLKGLIKQVLIMGGAARGGNVTPCAEFNVCTDPHAAQVVFKSGIPVVMCGLDVTLRAYLTVEERQSIISRNTPVCRFFGQSTARLLAIHERGAKPGLCLHDVCPVLYLSRPELFSGQEGGVYVETQGTVTNGKTVTDLWSDKKFPDRHVFVVLDVDRSAFVTAVKDALWSY